MKNLLFETRDVLEEHGKTFEDVKWIGNKNFYVDIDKFMELANTKYNSNYGCEKVANDLMIVGSNWWLERAEYDGAEWWEFKQMPKKPKKELELKALTCDQAKKNNPNKYYSGCDLLEMNNLNEEEC